MKRTVKTNIAVFITMFAVLACSTYLFAQSVASPDLMYFPDPSAKVSMDFKDASLRDILKSFSILSGLNFVATENVQERKVTLYLDNVPVRDALDKIFKANNLAYELEPESNIFIVKDLGKPEIDLISRTYYLKYIQVPKTNMMKESGSAGSGIGEVLTNILSENGKMAEDPRTNSIVITDVATRFPMIEQTIMSLDVPQPQVLIEVEIVDTTKNIVDEMGFTWSGNFLSFQAATVPHGTKFPFGSLIPDISKARRQSANGSAWLTDGKFDTSGITATLKLLSTITDTKYLARPRILTINNETAEIKITTDEVIGKKTTTSAAEGGLSTETAEAERALRRGLELGFRGDDGFDQAGIEAVQPRVLHDQVVVAVRGLGRGEQDAERPLVRGARLRRLDHERIAERLQLALGQLLRDGFDPFRGRERRSRRRWRKRPDRQGSGRQLGQDDDHRTPSRRERMA